VRARLEPHLGQPKRIRKDTRKRESRPLCQQVVARRSAAFANVKQFRYLHAHARARRSPLRAVRADLHLHRQRLLVGLFAAALVPSMLVALLLWDRRVDPRAVREVQGRHEDQGVSTTSFPISDHDRGRR
jgi:hypothetical protein